MLKCLILGVATLKNEQEKRKKQKDAGEVYAGERRYGNDDFLNHADRWTEWEAIERLRRLVAVAYRFYIEMEGEFALAADC